MPQHGTEMRSDLGIGLDALAPAEMARVLIAGQRAALEAVDVAREAIGRAAARMAETLGAGGRLAYGGAGSSALMAAADALELGGTFGVSPERILILMAGGLPVDARMPGASEDDEAAGRAAAAVLDARDLMIAVSASGRTPYALGLAHAARDRGAAVIAIANVPGAPLLALADIPVCLPTPPEIVAGSTRLGAGTAQKAALNAMSTIMGALTGRIHDGFMVGLVADNAKLRARAAGMVAEIAHVTPAEADAALAQTGGAVKPAILLAAGAQSAGQALALLDECRDNLRAALARLNGRAEKRPGSATEGRSQ